MTDHKFTEAQYIEAARLTEERGYRMHADMLTQAARAVAEVEETPLTGVVDEVLAELERAVAKFPTWPTDVLHAAAVVGEEAGEIYKAALQAVYEPHKSLHEDVREEAIQTAAMCIRFVLSMDVYTWSRCEQHSQYAFLREKKEG